MKTYEIMTLIAKISQNKEAATKKLLDNLFSHYPEWGTVEKAKFVMAATDAFEKTVEEFK